jgi:UDP-glucose 4-epimerase
MPRCLVTGGAGFIGSHLVEALVVAGNRVRVLDDLSTGRRDNFEAIADGIEFVEGSVLDADTVREAVKSIDWVFHLAALPSVPRSIANPFTTHDVCATGTVQLLDAVRHERVDRFVYAASSSAYGDLPQALRREVDLVAPLSPYAAAKLAGEHYCHAFGAAFGIDTVRLRLFNVYGPRQDPNSPYAAVIPRFLTTMMAGKPPVIFGDGQQSRDFTYVTDVVRALLLAAEAPAAVGQVYNIAGGRSISLLELVGRLNQLLGTHLRPNHQPPRVGDVRQSQADLAAARRDLGYAPNVGLEEGLGLTLRGLRATLHG